MSNKALPFMALSYEAVCSCIEHNVEIIYVDMEIYKEYAPQIQTQLKENGYDPKGYPARRGIFFTHGMDISCYEISDPYRLF